MLASRGEIKIHEILEMAELNFKEEFIFEDLVSNTGHPLRFDFAVFDDNGNLDFLIEYQGIQHYEAKSKFGGYSGLRKQQYNDMKSIYDIIKEGLLDDEDVWMDRIEKNVGESWFKENAQGNFKIKNKKTSFAKKTIYIIKKCFSFFRFPP